MSSNRLVRIQLQCCISWVKERLGRISIETPWQVTSTPPFSVVIEEIIESPADPRSSDLGKGQAPPTIGGFTPLVLALPAVTVLASSSIQEGTTIVFAIRGFNPLFLPKPASRESGVSDLKALEAILPVWWSLIRRRSL